MTSDMSTPTPGVDEPGDSTTKLSFEEMCAKFVSTPKYIIPAVVVLIGLLFGLIYITSLNSTRNEGIAQENALEAAYSDNQNSLSAYVLTVKEQLQIADRKSDKLDKVLTDAVSGRYDSDLAAATPGEASQLISALTEAYPDLEGLDAYDRILTEISAGREGFANDQSVLLDQIRSYETWLDQGLWHSYMVRTAGFPSNRLEARIGDQVTYGAEALEQMKRIVLEASAKRDFATGETAPLDLNPDDPGEN